MPTVVTSKRKNSERKKKKNDEKEKDTDWDPIEGPDELGKVWQEFLANKFSATKLEQARQTYEDLGRKDLKEEDQLTIKEYLEAVHGDVTAGGARATPLLTKNNSCPPHNSTPPLSFGNQFGSDMEEDAPTPTIYYNTIHPLPFYINTNTTSPSFTENTHTLTPKNIHTLTPNSNYYYSNYYYIHIIFQKRNSRKRPRPNSIKYSLDSRYMKILAIH